MKKLRTALVALVGGLRKHRSVSDDLGAALILATVIQAVKGLEAELVGPVRAYELGYAQAVKDVLELME